MSDEISVNSSKTTASKEARGRKKQQSKELEIALAQVKDFMTDPQKALVLLREGKNYMESEKHRAAIECFGYGISLNPTQVSFYTNRATSHKALDMWREAYFDYSFAIRLESDTGAHYCNRGTCLVKLKKIEMALEDLDVACVIDPCSTFYFARACAYLDIHKYARAIDDLSRAIESEATHSDLKLRSLYRRAQAYFDLNRLKEADQDLTEVLQHDPNSIPSRILLGKSLKVQGELKSAEEQLHHILALDSASITGYIERGDIRYMTGRKNKLIDSIYDFDKAINMLDAKVTKMIAAAGCSNEPSKVVSHLRNAIAQSTSATSPWKGGNTNNQNRESLELSRSLTGSISETIQTFPNNNSVYYNQIFGLQEVEETLSDALYKRSQAKLSLDSHEAIIVEALDDATRAFTIDPLNDDYGLLCGICNIRLKKFDDASHYLQEILVRSPDNEKALYHNSFCQRSLGKRTDAIEGLTKMISMLEGEYMTTASTIPIHVIYESRGTILHEVQAHKLALSDLARAIMLHPGRAENYFLRADCHAKLGNYEMAIKDYNFAESAEFSDMSALYLSRGMVHRLRSDIDAAIKDFSSALTLVDPKSKIAKIRILSLQSICLIDQESYSKGFAVTSETLKLVRRQLKVLDGTIPEEDAEDLAEEMKPVDRAAMSVMGLESGGLLNDPHGSNSSVTKKVTSTLPIEAESEKSLKKLEWIMRYHLALCLYMMGKFKRSEEELLYFLTEDSRQISMDKLTLGRCAFFLAMSQLRLQKAEDCIVNIRIALDSRWAVSERNRFLCTFVLAKAEQILGNYEAAIVHYSAALELEQGNPYVLFRRAWSYKALGDFKSAGIDFEIAKRLKSDDPNFSLDYKSTFSIDYIEINSEPDLIEKFRSLLPLPGSL